MCNNHSKNTVSNFSPLAPSPIKLGSHHSPKLCLYMSPNITPKLLSSMVIRPSSYLPVSLNEDHSYFPETFPFHPRSLHSWPFFYFFTALSWGSLLIPHLFSSSTHSPDEPTYSQSYKCHLFTRVTMYNPGPELIPESQICISWHFHFNI